MFDVALHYGARVNSEGGLLASMGLKPGSYVLATIHRAENTDHPQRLANLMNALIITARSMPVVWPLHPRTREIIKRVGRLDKLSRQLHLIEPVGYLDMVQLEKYAAVIATDSGGVQKEAFFYKVPCITLRDETEWVELLAAGWNRLAPPVDSAAILAALLASLGGHGEEVTPYGQGNAAHMIVQRLLTDLT